jgi:NhaP-type Na+/H+ or K+/H+ antiporter
MSQHEQLIAYLATLGALVTVVVAGLVTAALYPDILGKVESFGFGTITGGLIGVLRIPAQRSAVVENADTVNQRP